MRKSKEAELSDSKDPKTLQDADRIEFIRSDRWINYEVARDALARLNDLLIYPPRDRMPCLLIYGATGMGKTKIIRKFVRDHAAVFDRAAGVTRMPVVSFQMPPLPEEGPFYDELFLALGAPAQIDRTIKKTKHVCRNLLQAAGTRMLIVDEIHSMLSGTARAQRVFLNTLRFLANDIRIPLVCVGTDEARMALLTDSQLAERFDALELPRWTDDHSFERLLTSITAILPLRKFSQLNTPGCRKAILNRTDGVTTRIFRLIESAVVEAIRDGSECITEDTLISKNLVLPLVSMTRKTIQRAHGG
ncbi:MAG: TniB family NTP-binding protein [Rhodomicrobium sp.]